MQKNKTTRKWIVPILVLTLLVSGQANAQSVEVRSVKYNNYFYDIYTDGTAHLSMEVKKEWINTQKYDDNCWTTFRYSGKVVLPESIVYKGKTYAVTEIDRAWGEITSFQTNPNLTLVRQGAFDSQSLTEVIWCVKNGFKRCEIPIIDPDDKAIIGYDYFYPFENQTKTIKNFYITEDVEEIPDGLFWNSKAEIVFLGIPERKKIKKIREEAFESFTGKCNLNDVLSDEGVEFCWHAFSGCNTEFEITIQGSETKLKDECFWCANGLKKLTIGPGVKTLAKSAFSKSGLETVHFTSDCELEEINEKCFEDCQNLLQFYSEDKPELPKSLKKIGSNGLASLKSITKLDLSQTQLEDFPGVGYCSNVTEVLLPNTLKTIGEYAFMDCSSLKSLDVPNSVTSMDFDTFRGCNSLERLTIGEGLKEWNIRDNDGATEGCSSLKEVYWNAVHCKDFSGVVDDGDEEYWSFPFATTIRQFTKIKIGPKVEHIPAYLFYNVSNKSTIELDSLVIPDNVTSIGEHAFQDWSGKSNFYLYISKNLTHIGSYAFFKVASKASLSLPEGCQLDQYALAHFYGLEHIDLPSDMKTIPDGTFRNINLHEITIPASVETIGEGAFLGCESLSDINLAEGLKHIEANAFDGCKSLKTIKLPNSLETIGVGALPDLTSLTIPENLQKMGYMQYGVKLTHLIWNAKNCEDFPRDKDIIFNNQIDSITFGNKVEHIPACICKNQDKIEEVILPASLKTIGYHAFNGCTRLYDVYCAATTPPTISDNDKDVFSNYNGTLYVPQSSYKEYSRHNIWGNFKEILNIEDYLPMGDKNDPTLGISNPTTRDPWENSSGTTTYYNLKGHRVKHPSKGFYIKNGKKFIVTE